jgi:hypothetical protein
MNFEIWGQDIGNIDLSHRDLYTFGSRDNYLYPLRSKPIQPLNLNINTRNPQMTREHWELTPTGLCRLDIESGFRYPPNRPDLQTSDTRVDKEAQQQLYMVFQQSGAHPLCFPNIDRNFWDNTTKAIYRTKDHRDKNRTIAYSQNS